MFFDLYDLYQDIIKFDKLYIYGMGMHSEMIVPKLYDLGLGTRIAGYVLSECQTRGQFKGNLPIYGIEEMCTEASAALFLIATSSQYENEIADKLKSHNYNQYLFLSYYERNGRDVYVRFKKADFEQYCKYIVEWYEYKHCEEIGSEYIENHQRICSEVRELFQKKMNNINARANKQIVFVVAALHPRISKIIGALIKRGYEIIVLNIDRSTYPYSKYEEKNIRVIHCECIEEVLYEAANLTPLLFYVRPKWLNSSVANIMLMQRELYGKIIIDIHDIAKGSYNLPPEQHWLYDIEKEALESADGVVWRYDAEDFLKEKYGYQYRGKSIQFWDFCYDEFAFHESEDSAVLKLCYIDSNAECLNPDNNQELSKEGIIRFSSIYDILNKIGQRNDCEFHLYISKISEKNMKKLKELNEKYGNFFFEVGHSPEEIIQSISLYDYGCSLDCFGRIPTEAECIEKGFSYLPGVYEISAANRQFDFLNAGLPIIASYDGRRQIEYLKKYGVIVDMFLESLDIEYLKANKDMYRKNVREAAKYLSISAQIDRLIDFFNAL